MKAIKFCGEIGSVTSKRDGSMGLRIATPELKAVEKAAVMNLQGINVDVFIKPLDSPPNEVVHIDKDLDSKSQSQRTRSVLFLLWKQENEPYNDFNIYYKQKTEKYIDFLKDKLED